MIKRLSKKAPVIDEEPESKPHEYYQKVDDPYAKDPRYETFGEALKAMYQFNKPCVMVDMGMGGLMIVTFDRVPEGPTILFAKASHTDRPVPLTTAATRMQAQALKQALAGIKEEVITQEETAKPKKLLKRPLSKKKR